MNPPSTRMYTHPFFEATHPRAPPPDPRLKPGPVFVTSGGVINTQAPAKIHVRLSSAVAVGLPSSTTLPFFSFLIWRRLLLGLDVLRRAPRRFSV